MPPLKRVYGTRNRPIEIHDDGPEMPEDAPGIDQSEERKIFDAHIDKEEEEDNKQCAPEIADGPQEDQADERLKSLLDDQESDGESSGRANCAHQSRKTAKLLSSELRRSVIRMSTRVQDLKRELEALKQDILLSNVVIDGLKHPLRSSRVPERKEMVYSDVLDKLYGMCSFCFAVCKYNIERGVLQQDPKYNNAGTAYRPTNTSCNDLNYANMFHNRDLLNSKRKLLKLA